MWHPDDLYAIERSRWVERCTEAEHERTLRACVRQITLLARIGRVLQRLGERLEGSTVERAGGVAGAVRYR